MDTLTQTTQQPLVPPQAKLDWLIAPDFPLPTVEDFSSPLCMGRWMVRIWDWFWFCKTDPTPLAVIRIFTGLMVFYIHLVYSAQLFALMGEHAWIDHATMSELRHTTPFAPPPDDWTEAEYHSGNPYARGYDIFSVWFHVTDPTWMVLLHIGFLTAMAMFTVGFGTRITGVITWIGLISYIQRAPTSLFGMDTIMNVLVIYLTIGASGATLSVDRWLACWWARRHGEPEPPVEPSASANFALRLMQIHFCIIYLASGASKLQGAAWWNGTAMWGTLANYEFTPLNWEFYENMLVWLCQHRWLWEIAGAGVSIFTLALEIFFVMLVWWRPTRWVMICGAVALHVGIGVIMGLSTFSLIMLCLLLSFVPAETMHACLARLRSPRRIPARLVQQPTPTPASEVVLSGNP